MKTIYVETSAVLSWLLGEQKGEMTAERINNADRVVTSVLTRLETERSLLRAEKNRIILPADRQKLLGLFRKVSSGWFFLSISDQVLNRSCGEFPVEPVRSLDAVHLASALESVQLFQNISVLSYDSRVLHNLEPLGLDREV